MEDVARARTVAHRANAQCQQLDRNRTPFRSTYLYIYTLKILSRGKSQLFLIFLTFFLIFIYFVCTSLYFYIFLCAYLYIFVCIFVYFYTRIYIFLYVYLYIFIRGEGSPLLRTAPSRYHCTGGYPLPRLKEDQQVFFTLFLRCFCVFRGGK